MFELWKHWKQRHFLLFYLKKFRGGGGGGAFPQTPVDSSHFATSANVTHLVLSEIYPLLNKTVKNPGIIYWPYAYFSRTSRSEGKSFRL